MACRISSVALDAARLLLMLAVGAMARSEAAAHVEVLRLLHHLGDQITTTSGGSNSLALANSRRAITLPFSTSVDNTRSIAVPFDLRTVHSCDLAGWTLAVVAALL